MIEHWECQWYDTDKHIWQVSWVCDTEDDAKTSFVRDKSYFYRRVQLRIVHWKGEVIATDTGTQ